MESFRNDDVEKLLGDFFERHTAGDKDGMSSALRKIETMIYAGEVDSAPFREYFNSMYTGRSAFNAGFTVTDYPKESILRELFQNTFGCEYEDKDIKVIVDFIDDGQVKMTYNEVGFNLEQIFYYLSIGRNDGVSEREGRFGLGSKSVFANVESFRLRSNNYSVRVVNDGGTIKIRELELTAPLFKNTEIVFKVSEEEQAEMHKSLSSMCTKKGIYINLVELCFAFIRKKHLRHDDAVECPDKSFNIAVMDHGKPEIIYKIVRHKKDENDIEKVRFLENGKSVMDFIWLENNGFVYLIPFAVAASKRETVVKVIKELYNYFSTYELTGLIKASGEDFLQEKLSAFFISIPNKFITSNRAGIRHDCVEEVAQSISVDLMFMVEKYRQYFVLDLMQRQNSPYYYLRPKHYVFEFFNNYITSSTLAQDIRDKFNENISVIFPQSDTQISYTTIKSNGYYSEKNGVFRSEHDDGSAVKELFEVIEHMQAEFGEGGDHTLVAKYNWYDQEKDEGGSEFVYAFYFDGNKYVVSSDKNPAIRDYNLSCSFKSIVSLKLNKCVINGAVADENALGEALAVCDDMFGEDYRIVMKYFQFIITHGETTVQFEVSRIIVGNLKKAYDIITKHERRFETHQIFNEVIALIINSFTNGKDTMAFLREIKSQGGEITLALDINKRFRFSAYGRQFMIPPSVTNGDLLEIIGDVYSLINCGMFNGRVFDFPCTHSQYSYDLATVTSIFENSDTDEEKISNVLENIFICDLSIEKIALLDKNSKIIKIIDLDEEIKPAEREKAVKFIVLTDNLSKPVFSQYIEYLITGKNDKLLMQFYSSTEEPNQVLLDQIPYYFKPIPEVTKSEFRFLQGELKRISTIENPRIYKNYFVRDINSKLFGYGAKCPCCGYESKIINSFTVKNFSAGLLYDGRERKFNFSLYMCANDSFAASGWIIDDVSIGGMSPFLWLDEIAGVDVIPPEFLYCQIKYRPQITYDVIGGISDVPSDEQIYDGAQETLDFILSPLMAAKWFEDNRQP